MTPRDPGGRRGQARPGPGPHRAGPVLRIRRTLNDGQAVLALSGEMDLITAGAVRTAMTRLLRHRPARVMIDLRALSFCDCAGVRVLREAQQRAAVAEADFRLVAPGPVVIRVLTLAGADDLLAAAPSAPGADPEAAQPGTVSMNPPAPLPETVAEARRYLNEQYAHGVDRLLWELDKRPMPDLDAVRLAVAAGGRADTADVAAALVLLQAARLGLDRLEYEVFQTAYAAGIDTGALAAALELPGARAVAARQHWLGRRRELPYREPEPPRPGVPGGLGQAAARAERGARQAADRAAQIGRRLDQLGAAPGQRPRLGRTDAEQSAAHAGEARIRASEALERAKLALLRSAAALERCAVSYEELARADDAHRLEFRQKAARSLRAAAEYRQLAGLYRPGGPSP